MMGVNGDSSGGNCGDGGDGVFDDRGGDSGGVHNL